MSVVTDKKGGDGRPIPILATDRKQLPKLLASLNAAEWRWIERCEFDAAPNTFALIPDTKGAIARVVLGVRDIVNTPAEDMGPGELSQAVRKEAESFAGKFREWVGDELLAGNFPAIHAVGRAAARPPRLLEIRWGNPKHARLAIVGKGVCFDSGGLDLKTHEGMRLMKKDLGGAAHALALSRLVMQR